MKFSFNTKYFSSAIIFLFFFNTYKIPAITIGDSNLNLETTINKIIFENNSRPNPILQVFKKNRTKNKKITAAILAFPLPFGIVGLHRIYLGCAPYIPVVYIASLGGALGILPLIDFIILLNNDDLEKFSNSNKVFMWVE